MILSFFKSLLSQLSFGYLTSFWTDRYPDFRITVLLSIVGSTFLIKTVCVQFSYVLFVCLSGSG